ncbi:MAG: glucose-1-phosphate adenylyltransferase subunit GlgD [Clostridiales bacterium]|nr:glucose-1-phosphate adenylyltransferase subunit GlgD [Clostridiales bacterium]
MAAKNVLGIIFSNSYDESIPQLTALRTMGSVPFAGRYRLIDFQLSGMVNSGITKVGVLCNSNYRSLMDHIGNGKSWDLARKKEGLNLLPPFSLPDSGNFKGKTDALYGSLGYISNSGKEYVLLTDCNVVCNVDYDKMLKYAAEKNADAVFAYHHGTPSNIKNTMEFAVEPDGKIASASFTDGLSGEKDYSINVVLIKRILLERLLHTAHSAGISDLETVFIGSFPGIRAFGYKQDGFVRVIDSLESFYRANMLLLNSGERERLFKKDKPVYTKTGDRAPTFYGIEANVKNSLIADGCNIEGVVENSILFRNVTVEKGAVVRNSIIMQGTFISEKCDLNCVIADKSVFFRANKSIKGDENYPIYIGKGIKI